MYLSVPEKGPSSDNPPSTVEQWLDAIEKMYAKNERQKEFVEEKPFLQMYLSKLAEMNDKGLVPYTIQKPWNMGGSGIIFKAVHKNIKDRALVVKINRPLPREKLPLIEDKPISMVENERQVLPMLEHANIISLVDSGIFDIAIGKDVRPLSFIVEPLIPEAKSLREYVNENLTLSGVKDVTPSMTDQSLRRLVDLVHQWVGALALVHKKGYVYLDLKPDNALVDRDGHLVSIDFGSVQKIDKNSNASVDIFVTKYFAHPVLTTKLARGTSENRVRYGVMRKELTENLDFYSLGKSILYLLEALVQKEAHPHDFPQRPLFRSLHFLATRLLDGENSKRKKTLPEPVTKDEKAVVKEETLGEVFIGLEAEDYKDIHYVNLEDVLIDLDKEYGSWNPENVIPELSTFSKDVMRVVPDVNTVMTPRLRDIIEHPLVARLKAVSQLGLVSLVYTTADHSRYDHILGAYTYSASYIKSLFHDSQNPMFRNLVDERHIKGALLAALLHDLGQYPLAHDLEEVSPKIFSHSGLSIQLLKDDTANKDGKRLIDLIQDKDSWNVDLSCVEEILGAHTHASSSQKKLTEIRPKDFKAEMISALIDGPIDADKADYIIRDSTQCRIPYGEQLDIERLLRVMTLVRIPSYFGSGHKLTIGVYEKGRASADSFGLARYLLHSSVYWHHTSRIIKSMLQYATVMLLPPEVFGQGSDKKIEEVRTKLVSLLLELVPPFQLSSTRTETTGDSKRKIAVGKDIRPSALDENTNGEVPEKQKTKSWYPGITSTDWLMLEWVKKLGNNVQAKRLIENIQERELYKRTFAFRRDEPNEDLITQLDQLSWLEKVAVCQKVSEAVKVSLERKMESELLSRSLADPTEIAQVFDNNLAVLLDIPNPKVMITSERPLIYVSELERKTYFDQTLSPMKAEGLSKSLELLMQSISPVRVLCHPKVRQPILLYFDKNEIKHTLERAIHEVKG